MSRRMFNSLVISSDTYLDMPRTADSLYFHLNMAADDDGMVMPKRVMRMIGASDDDLKILVAKGYIILFPSGVCAVVHWHLHNTLKKDRYTPTQWVSEHKTLQLVSKVYRAKIASQPNSDTLEPKWNQNGTKTFPKEVSKEVSKEEASNEADENAATPVSLFLAKKRICRILPTEGHADTSPNTRSA